MRHNILRMVDQLRDIARSIPSDAHSDKYDADCDWLLRDIADRLAVQVYSDEATTA